MDIKMSEQQINKYATDFLKEAYDMDLSIPIKINTRLSRVLGRFRRRDNKSYQIEISKQYLQYGELEDIKGTIKHEIIHYALFEQGRDYKDGQSDFENELIKHGSHLTKTVQFKSERNVNLYKCKCTTHIKKRALSHEGRYHKCSSCLGSLTYTGKKKMMV